MIKIEQISVHKLTPYEKNNKKHTDYDVGEIAKSIERYGMNDPIGVWGKKNIIVEGHGRFLACRKLGMEIVPCVRLDHLSDSERREYAILHNKTQELSEYDFENLSLELEELDLSGFSIDFGINVPGAFVADSSVGDDGEDEYERKKKAFEERMQAGENLEEDEEYQEFLEKFSPKKTTDDCYTPSIVYDAVADYVAERYGINKERFVRPFYPGGDYQKEEYRAGDVVVDNPHLTLFSAPDVGVSYLIAGVGITYENGAVVSTSFVTNLESCALRSCPKLYKAVDEANKKNLRENKKELPRYSYPLSLVTSAMIAPYSRYGIDFELSPDECSFIRALDAQKDSGKVIFGSGFLISDSKKAEREKAEREKAEREKAEREKAEVWCLSDREKQIIERLK